MKETIYIRLAGGPDAPMAWRTEGEDESRQGVSPLGDIAERAQGAHIVVLIPGTDCLLTSTTVPTRKRQRVIQALPFALEDRMAGDVEALHFAVGGIEADGTAHAAVVSKECMDDWLRQMHEAGIRPHALHPESVALPFEPDAWSLLLGPGEALLRTGINAGLGLDVDSVEEVLAMAIEGTEKTPDRIRLFECREGEVGPPLVIEGIQFETEQCTDPLAVLARGVRETHPVNLLQGDYGHREELGRRWRPWRNAAILAAIILTIRGGLSIQHWWQLSRDDARLETQIETLYRETFPEARRVVDPRQQMQQHLEALQGGVNDPFSELLASVGPVLDDTQGLKLEGLRYREGQLEIDLTLGNLQSLDGLKEQLVAVGGLQVDIASANARDDRVESRLTIRGAGA